MPDKPSKPFSKRHGYSGQPREISIREDAPENLRHFVLETASELGVGTHTMRSEMCSMLHLRPDPNNWSEGNVWSEVQDLMYSCDWFRVYDFAERMHHRLQNKDGGGSEASRHAAEFQVALNDFFIEQGIGWQMVDGEIVSRGTEAFEATVQEAVRTLDTASRTTSRDEIHEALADLSRRPKPDL